MSKMQKNRYEVEFSSHKFEFLRICCLLEIDVQTRPGGPFTTDLTREISAVIEYTSFHTSTAAHFEERKW